MAVSEPIKTVIEAINPVDWTNRMEPDVEAGPGLGAGRAWAGLEAEQVDTQSPTNRLSALPEEEAKQELDPERSFKQLLRVTHFKQCWPILVGAAYS